MLNSLKNYFCRTLDTRKTGCRNIYETVLSLEASSIPPSRSDKFDAFIMTGFILLLAVSLIMIVCLVPGMALLFAGTALKVDMLQFRNAVVVAISLGVLSIPLALWLFGTAFAKLICRGYKKCYDFPDRLISKLKRS